MSAFVKNSFLKKIPCRVVGGNVKFLSKTAIFEENCSQKKNKKQTPKRFVYMPLFLIFRKFFPEYNWITPTLDNKVSGSEEDDKLILLLVTAGKTPKFSLKLGHNRTRHDQKNKKVKNIA